MAKQLYFPQAIQFTLVHLERTIHHLLKAVKA